MAFHLFVFLLAIFLFLCLALLWRLCWFPFHQRRLKPVLLCGSLPILDTGSRLVAGAESISVASGGRADLRSGEEKLKTSQTRASHTSDADLNNGRSHGRENSVGPLWTAVEVLSYPFPPVSA